MKLISWNVNGLRAVVGKGFADIFNELDADIFCLQETKLQEGQIDLELPGYHQYWNYAKKKGYEISAPAAASLKTLLRERMQSGYSVEYEDIMAIIEEAIASLEKRNMKNLFMTVLDNKYEEAAMFMLQPEDFKNINIPD